MAKSKVAIVGLQAAEIVALSKVKAEKLTPGDHPVDFTVHVAGVLRKGDISMAVPTVAIPYKAVLAFLVRRMGVTRDAAIKHLTAAMSEAMKAGETVNLETVEAAETAVKEMLGKLPKIPRSGATTLVGDLVVERVGNVEAVEAPEEAPETADVSEA